MQAKRSKYRKKLAELYKEHQNEFLQFSGVFKRVESRRLMINGRPHNVKAILLVDVRDKKHNKVADHLWIEATGIAAQVEYRDVVHFKGQIGTYCKGYLGFNPKIERNIELDYGVKNIKIVRIERREVSKKIVLQKEQEKLAVC